MDSFAELWEMVKEECKNQVSESIYNVWFKDMELVSFDDNKVVIALSDFKRKIVESRFMDKLESSFKNVIGFDIQIILVDVEKAVPVKAEETEDALTDEDTFDSFIVGASNKFAYAAANAVANDPGGKYNPLFIHGNSGLGKTHLLNAIAHQVKLTHPEANIVYTRGESLSNISDRRAPRLFTINTETPIYFLLMTFSLSQVRTQLRRSFSTPLTRSIRQAIRSF